MDKQINRAPVHVVIIGASGHARVIADIVRCAGDVVEGFLDDREAAQFPGMTMLGPTARAAQLAGDNPALRFIIGIGRNETRELMAERFGSLPYHIAVHPSAVIAADCAIGPGTVVMANAAVNTGSVIGRHCIVNTAATVDHDGRLADFVHLSPGAHLAGAVSVGRGSWLGIGTAVCNNIAICPGCVVGAGAAVVRDIREAGTYVGVPASKLVKS